MDFKRHSQGIRVTRLYSAHQESICDHFLRLDPRSRRARFCGTVSDMAVLEYAKTIFQYDSIVCGAFIEGQLRGVVELRGIFHSRRSTTEAAFSVEPDWQNIGIGDALFERIFTLAQNRGVRTIHMICMKENSRMRHLATKHHALLRSNHDDVDAVLHPYWPTLASIMKEVVGETTGYTQRLIEQTYRSGAL